MPRGPAPKDPELRQRRNKASTASELTTPDAGKTRVPSLNMQMLGLKRGQGAVRPTVLAWWRDAWQSPMASRWLKTDVQVLLICARLRQQLQLFLEEGKSISTVAGEIRQQEGRIGLDVMSRRRLDWRIEGPREPDRPVAPIASAPPEDEVEDPRRRLRAVN